MGGGIRGKGQDVTTFWLHNQSHNHEDKLLKEDGIESHNYIEANAAESAQGSEAGENHRCCNANLCKKQADVHLTIHQGRNAMFWWKEITIICHSKS